MVKQSKPPVEHTAVEAHARTTKGRIVHPPDQIEEAVKRYLAGENVNVLCKYYKVSRAGFYLWAKNYKKNAEKRARIGTGPSSDLIELKEENASLRLQVRELREMLLSKMIKLKEI